MEETSALVALGMIAGAICTAVWSLNLRAVRARPRLAAASIFGASALAAAGLLGLALPPALVAAPAGCLSGALAGAALAPWFRASYGALKGMAVALLATVFWSPIFTIMLAIVGGGMPPSDIALMMATLLFWGLVFSIWVTLPAGAVAGAIFARMIAPNAPVQAS